MTRLFVLLSLCLALVVMPGVTRAEDTIAKTPPVEKKKANPTVTVGNVTYVVIESYVTGDDQQWTLVLEATSNLGYQKILIARARAITAEGKTCDIKAPMGGPTSRRTSRRTPKGTVDLPEGVKIQLELNMGALTKGFEGVKAVSRLELFGAATRRSRRDRGLTTTTIPGQPYNTQTKTILPLVLQNVPIERLTAADRKEKRAAEERENEAKRKHELEVLGAQRKLEEEQRLAEKQRQEAIERQRREAQKKRAAWEKSPEGQAALKRQAEAARKAALQQQEKEAAKQLRLARLIYNNGAHDKAAARLQQLIGAYPATSSAVTARELLKEWGY